MFSYILTNVKLILSILALFLAFGLGWSWNGSRWENKFLEAQAATQEAIKAETERMQRIKDEAAETSIKQLQARERDVAATRSERDRLRQQLSDNQSRFAEATSASIAAYTATLSDVFEHCTREYTEVAAKADGHSADATILFETWNQLATKGK